MVRLPMWCASCVFLALSVPIHAAPLGSTAASVAPDVFGSVALKVTTTPYDSKWRTAGFTGRGRVGSIGPSRAAVPSFSDLARVQAEVNNRLTYRADSHGRDAGDRWSSAAETLARGSGDCEDYAIAKGQFLLAAGFRPQDLYLVIGTDRVLRIDHAILVVRTGAKFWVLDNLTSGVVEAADYRDFSPVITLSADRKWVHGYEAGAQRRIARAREVSTSRIAAVRLAQGAAARAWSPKL